MSLPSPDWQNVGLWDQIKTRLEPVGVVFLILGVGVLLGAAFAPIDPGLRTTLLGISLALFSVGLGFMAVGISTVSDIKYTEILLRLDRNVTKALEFLPGVDRFDFPPTSPRNVVITPPPATAYADVGGRVEVTTARPSKAQAQARLDADTKRVGYTRGELFQKEDGSWGIHWGGKYPL
jgi:hypothetical protein